MSNFITQFPFINFLLYKIPVQQKISRAENSERIKANFCSNINMKVDTKNSAPTFWRKICVQNNFPIRIDEGALIKGVVGTVGTHEM